ncbi:MAG TPA: hypothetical protein GXZ66_09810 [Clostridiaceae bacterium]|jgi:hypothetical protein|nr:hypothetical protein [Clostridiaceae bacterium]
MKRALFLMLALSMVLVFVSCNGGGGEPKATEDPKETKSSATPTPDPTASPTPEPTEDPTKTSEPPEGYDETVEVPKADIFDALIKDGTVTDQSENGLTVTNVNEAVVTKDDSIGKDVIDLYSEDRAFFAVFNFDTEYDKLADGFTFETSVNLNSPNAYQVVGGNQQAGGFCIDYQPDAANGNGALGFGVHNGTEYIKIYPEKRSEFDRYYHVVGVFDGPNVKLYINGRLIGQEELGNDMKFPPDIKYLAIGADTGVDDTGEYFLDGKISIFRLYNDSLNDSQIYKLYLQSLE